MALVEVTIALNNEDDEAEEALATIDLCEVTCFYAHGGAIALRCKGLRPATVVMVKGTDGFMVLETYEDFKGRFHSVTN